MLYSDPNFKTEYRGYDIALKRDLGDGYLIDGHKITYGFNVLKDGVNIMHGATWFLTVKDAKGAIDDLIASDGRDIDGYKEFWTRLALRTAVSDNALDLYRAIKDHLELTADATGGPRAKLAAVLAKIENHVDPRGTIVRADGPTERIGALNPAIRSILDEV